MISGEWAIPSWDKHCQAPADQQILHLWDTVYRHAGTLFIMRASSKSVSFILLCWLMKSETEVGCKSIEVEPSHQFHYVLLP